jgi:hypothetical protein
VSSRSRWLLNHSLTSLLVIGLFVVEYYDVMHSRLLSSPSGISALPLDSGGPLIHCLSSRSLRSRQCRPSMSYTTLGTCRGCVRIADLQRKVLTMSKGFSTSPREETYGVELCEGCTGDAFGRSRQCKYIQTKLPSVSLF